MGNKLTRREFLKLSGVAIGGLAIPFPLPEDESQYSGDEIGRVAHKSISVFKAPKVDAQTLAYRFLDELVNIYYDTSPASGPSWNPLWYRVWGGYIHSAYVQRVKVRFNQPLSHIPEIGHQLCEVTVPYTQIYYYTKAGGWEPKNKLYFETTHWAVGIDEGPDRQPWYRLYDELLEFEYHVPAIHLRPIPDEEITPISPDVPAQKKSIEIRLQEQRLIAYEDEKPVFETRVSTGIPNGKIPPKGTSTPPGDWNVYSKMPTKHMGDGVLTGAPDVYTLPGVPWTTFFHNTGVACHGAYWHNNFGVPMSHGCVNMRPSDAKWLFRWTTPVWSNTDEMFWEKRGFGTPVHVI